MADSEKTPMSPDRRVTIQDYVENDVCSVRLSSSKKRMLVEIPRGSTAIVLREAVAEKLTAQRSVEDPEVAAIAAVQISLVDCGKELDYSRPPPARVEAVVVEDPTLRQTANAPEGAPPTKRSRSLRRLLDRKLTYKSSRMSAGQSQVFGGEEEPSAYTLPPATKPRGYQLWILLMVLFGSSTLLLTVALSALWCQSSESSQAEAHDLALKLISRAESVTKKTFYDVLVQLQTQTAKMIKISDVPEIKLACLAVEFNSNPAVAATGSSFSIDTEDRLHQLWSELHAKFNVLHGLYFADTAGWLVGYRRFASQSQPYLYEGVYRPGDHFANLTGGCLSLCPPEEHLHQGSLHSFTTSRSGRFSEMNGAKKYDPRLTVWYRQAVQAKGRLVWVDADAESSQHVAMVSAVQATIVEGKVVMVSRADVALHVLTDYLMGMEKDRQAHGGVSFIVDRSDHLIASSSRSSDVSRTNPHTGEPEKLLWKQTSNPMIVKVATEVLKQVNSRSFANISSPGVQIHCDSEHVFSYQVAEEFPWIIVNSQPRQVYLGSMKDEGERIKAEFLAMHKEVLNRTSTQTMQTIAVSSIIIIFGGLVVAIISKSVERPLRSMRQDMKSVAKLDFDKLAEDLHKSESRVRRRGNCWDTFCGYLCGNPRLVREVSEMRDSFMCMANGLRSFAKYMDPYVVRALLDTGRVAELKVAPEEVTIFFSDMVGFTSIAESLPPTALMDLLKEYLEEMSNIILEKSGVVGEFIGDAVMAWWNAPIHVGPYHTVLALTAALEQQQRLVELRKKWAQQNKPKVEVRMGLACGDVLAGNIGSQRRMKYGLVGDSVNLASRLEGLCKYYGVSILIDERTYQAAGVEEKFFCRPVDLVAVKGRESSTEIYELVGNKDHMGDEEKERCSKFCSDFEEVHELYRQKQFLRALALISEFLDLWPMDTPAQIMKTRCERAMASEPDENWSPVQKMTDK